MTQFLPSTRLSPPTEGQEKALTINGQPISWDGYRPDMLLIDLLHEHPELRLTGTKFGCGVGACGACKVAIRAPNDDRQMPVLACYARLSSVDGCSITTVEGLAQPDGTLHPLQEAFLEGHAFQCGYSTPGFLMAAYVLLDQLEHQGGVSAERLDQTILNAIGGNLCRCTGYIRYFEAIRKVIEDRKLVNPATPAEDNPSPGVWFRLMKQSSNDVQEKVLMGTFEDVQGEITFEGELSLEVCHGTWTLDTKRLNTGEPVRDFNLREFFFNKRKPFLFKLKNLQPIDRRFDLVRLGSGTTIPVQATGELSYGEDSIPLQTDLLIRVVSETRLHVLTRTPFRFHPHELSLPMRDFSREFALRLGAEVEVNLDLEVPYHVRRKRDELDDTTEVIFK